MNKIGRILGLVAGLIGLSEARADFSGFYDTPGTTPNTYLSAGSYLNWTLSKANDPGGAFGYVTGGPTSQLGLDFLLGNGSQNPAAYMDFTISIAPGTPSGSPVKFDYTGGTQGPGDASGFYYQPVGGGAPTLTTWFSSGTGGNGNFTMIVNPGDRIGFWMMSDLSNDHAGPNLNMANFNVVPEPSSLAMLGVLGAAVGGLVSYRRMRASKRS